MAHGGYKTAGKETLIADVTAAPSMEILHYSPTYQKYMLLSSANDNWVLHQTLLTVLEFPTDSVHF